MDQEKVKMLQKKSKEFQKKYKEAQASKDEKKLRKLQQEQMELMKLQSEVMKDTMLKVTLLTLPIFWIFFGWLRRWYVEVGIVKAPFNFFLFDWFHRFYHSGLPPERARLRGLVHSDVDDNGLRPQEAPRHGLNLKRLQE